jgi:hypothetical protein
MEMVSGDSTTSSKPDEIALASISYVMNAEQAIKNGQKL